MERHDWRTRVLRQVEDSRDELVQLTQQLVRIPSVVGEEGEAQKYMERLYRDLGLEVDVFEADRQEVEQHPSYIGVKWPYSGRPNVVGVLDGAPGAPSIILNGHIDVVSAEPVGSWSQAPWEGNVVDGKIWGRGSADMKGGLAANYMALKSILACGIRPAGKVILQSVIEEEAGGGGGTLACFMRDYRASGIVCTEPQAFRVVVAHSGVNYFRVKVTGKPIHAGRAHLGINAIGKMLKVYEALVALDEARAARIRYPLFERRDGRSCNLSIGTFQAGDWPSTVAGSGIMEGRLGFVPGEKMADVKREVEETIQSVARADDWLREHPPTVEWFGWHAEPWEQDPEVPFIRSFAGTVEDVLGMEPDIAGLTAGLDARFGAYFDTPGLAFGPRGDNLHGVDEYVEIDSLVQAAQVLACSVLDWCGMKER